MNLISFYEYVRCGLWASSGPFPLSAHYGLYKRGRDPPTNPSRHLKKERSDLPLKWLLKEGRGRPNWRSPASQPFTIHSRTQLPSLPAPPELAVPPPLHGPLPFRASTRDPVVPCSRQPPYRTGVALRVSPTTLVYKRSLLPLAPRPSRAHDIADSVTLLPTPRSSSTRTISLATTDRARAPQVNFNPSF